MGRSERAKSVVKKQADAFEVWERAWGIIANAGDIWEKDTKEAKEWRWLLHLRQTKALNERVVLKKR